MAKKKKKIFPKKQLIALFENKNYQKLISKIKQFVIEDMSEEELLKLHLNSLENLSMQDFEKGDISRALRDVEMLIELKNIPSYQALKLKYLCYLESFEDAIKYAKTILSGIKDLKIKKEIIFYQLLANIYLNSTIDTKDIKHLTQAKQKYVLAILAFFNNDTKLCLEYLEECKPRLKEEKLNVEALKSIILNKDFLQEDMKKPLYRFLTFGDTQNLQNTKNTREIIPIVSKKNRQFANNALLKNLIDLKEPLSNTILKQQNDMNLVYNNIVLLTQSDAISEALKSFTYYADTLVLHVESMFLLINIYNKKDEHESEQKIVQFVKKYLQKHSDKLSPFQIKYIFYTIFTSMTHMNITSINKQYIQLADNYNQLTLVSIIQEPKNANDIEWANEFFKSYDKVNELVLKHIIHTFQGFAEIADFLDDHIVEQIIAKMDYIAFYVGKIDVMDPKYNNILLKLFDAMAHNLLEMSYDNYKKEYQNLATTIEHCMNIFKWKEDDLSSDMLDFMYAVQVENSSTSQESHGDYLSQALRELTRSFGEDDFDEEDFEEENLEYTFGEIFSEFKLALKSGENPYPALNNFPRFYAWFFDQQFTDIVFDFINEYARFKTLTLKAIEKIFHLTHFKIEDEIVRKRVPTMLNEYAKHSPKISLNILEYLIELKKDYKNAWYLQWLYIYIDIANKNAMTKDALFKKILQRFIEIQKKKKYVSFEKKYNKIVKLFAPETLEEIGSKQQTFDF